MSPRLGQKQRAWTSDEDARLRRMIRANSTIHDVARALDRSPNAVSARVRKHYGEVADYDGARGPMQEPIALPEAQTITAAFFGDPLPGRSALDRRGAA